MLPGESYEINVYLSHVDENPAKKDTESVAEELKIGENIYYVEYTAQIEDKLKDPEIAENGELKLYAGDYIGISVKNTSQTLYQVFKNLIYNINDTSAQITGEYAGLITTDGGAMQAIHNQNEVETYEIRFNIGNNASYKERKEGYVYSNDGINATVSKEKNVDLDLNPGIIENSDPEKTLAGWTKNEGSNRIDYYPRSKYKKNQNITLYAVWDVKKYRVTYNSNNPNNIILSEEYVVNNIEKGNYTINYTPQLYKYKFIKWTTNQNGTGKAYYNGNQITINNDITLYAQWEREPNKLIYDSNVKVAKVLYVGGYTSSGTYDQAYNQGKTIINYLSQKEEFNIENDTNDYIIINGNDTEDKNKKVREVILRKRGYDLVILNFTAWSLKTFGFNEEYLKSIAETNNLITIGNDEKDITLMQDPGQSIHQNDAEMNVEITGIGRQLIKRVTPTESFTRYDSSCYRTKFKDSVNVLYRVTYKKTQRRY